MRIRTDYKTFLPVISKSKLLSNIPVEAYPDVFRYLQVSIRDYKKDEIIQNLGAPMKCSGLVLDGIVEGSFISENYNKINMNQFTAGRSFGEALACVQTVHSPIQLQAVTDCTVMLLHLNCILSESPCPCSYQQTLSINLIKVLAAENVFSNLKLRIANQKAIRDRVLMYLYSMVPDAEGYLHVPFTQTALAEFLGVNRSALSRELKNMQEEGIILVKKKAIKLLRQ
ncbi:MAG: Crp/Fnr family transcriptional regulator [Eubacteriales bacterium]|jgi:CRP-like cAMP-binding protein